MTERPSRSASGNLSVRAVEAPHIDGPAGLRALRAEIAAELAEERGGPVFLAERDREPAWVAVLAAGESPAPNRFVRGGFVDDALLGWVAVRIDLLPEGGRLGVVEEIGVHPDARAIGLGEALLHEAVAWCRGEGCIGIDSYALPGARETKNFFETFGFTARLITVHHRFDTGAPEDASGTGGSAGAP